MGFGVEVVYVCPVSVWLVCNAQYVGLGFFRCDL